MGSIMYTCDSSSEGVRVRGKGEQVKAPLMRLAAGEGPLKSIGTSNVGFANEMREQVRRHL